MCPWDVFFVLFCFRLMLSIKWPWLTGEFSILVNQQVPLAAFIQCEIIPKGCFSVPFFFLKFLSRCLNPNLKRPCKTMGSKVNTYKFIRIPQDTPLSNWGRLAQWAVANAKLNINQSSHTSVWGQRSTLSQILMGQKPQILCGCIFWDPGVPAVPCLSGKFDLWPFWLVWKLLVLCSIAALVTWTSYLCIN